MVKKNYACVFVLCQKYTVHHAPKSRGRKNIKLKNTFTRPRRHMNSRRKDIIFRVVLFFRTTVISCSVRVRVYNEKNREPREIRRVRWCTSYARACVNILSRAR